MTSADAPYAPRQYPGVAVSSSFLDLQQHRAALMRAIEGQGLHPVAMEQDAALPAGTVVDSSLQKVRDAAAYVGIVSHRYGQVPDDDRKNPQRLSLTELEFREARHLGRPTLIFVMGRQHDVKPDAVEQDPENRRKLEAFREEVKRASAASSIQRVFKEFNSLSEFEAAAVQSVSELRRLLDARSESSGGARGVPVAVVSAESDTLPTPPALYAEPPYIGSHAFVGRTAQLESITDWASSAEPHPVLLFEAIGGTGKSMLTWEWTTRHASAVRDEWAGIFWYSFYEKGAVMADFCRRALAYMTRRPLGTFRKKGPLELSQLLLHQLQARRWLLMLDGLERILVAYHRYDFAQLPDEQAGRRDVIAHRDPCAAIRPEDDDLLRRLAGAAPSKILVTSRLVPRVLLNPASQPIPGVLLERLPGLRPAEAEALLRASGVRGASEEIQDYLQRHCDCHPLVTGVVAGLVNDYLPDRGNFDAWAADPARGGSLNLAELDLVQKRNHILESALAALPAPSRQLLSILALLSQAVDYATLSAFNPHLPPKPEEVAEPAQELEWLDLWWGDEDRERARSEHAAALQRRKEYEQALEAWRRSPAVAAAERQLDQTVADLERRGLLQFDPHSGGRWDLHPVVRGVAAGRLPDNDRDRLGQLVVDHFSQRPHDVYERAETLDDVRDGVQIVRTLLQMGRAEEAVDAYWGGLSHALLFNLDAPVELLSLVRPFFTADWTAPAFELDDSRIAYLANDAAMALTALGEPNLALELHGTSMRLYIRSDNWRGLATGLLNACAALAQQGRFAKAELCARLSLTVGELLDDAAVVFSARLQLFNLLSLCGRWADAEAVWQTLDSMGRDWPRHLYRLGDAELNYAYLQFFRQRLTEGQLAEVEQLIRSGGDRGLLRQLHNLRGAWLMTLGEWGPSTHAFAQAIRMAHETGQADTAAETFLALARLKLGELQNAHHEADRLSSDPTADQQGLAKIWHALGNPDKAATHALYAYKLAWADGAPYVFQYGLDEAAGLLTTLGAEIPDVPDYNPEEDPRLPWEDNVTHAIEKLRTTEEPDW